MVAGNDAELPAQPFDLWTIPVVENIELQKSFLLRILGDVNHRIAVFAIDGNLLSTVTWFP